MTGSLEVQKYGGLGSGNVTVNNGASLKLGGVTGNTYLASAVPTLKLLRLFCYLAWTPLPGTNRIRLKIDRMIRPMISSKQRSLVPFLFWIALFLLCLPATASAHTETGTVGGFVSGFRHPLTGLDHIVAMVAVGLWGAFLGGQAMWMLPVIFPVVMAFGGALGVLGVPLPAVETGIAISGIALGLMVAMAARPPLWVAGVIVGFFAIFHGHAHGSELPASANALTYSVGFVIATGLLHLSGIAFGLLVRWPWGKISVRVGGGVIACIGFGFLFHFL